MKAIMARSYGSLLLGMYLLFRARWATAQFFNGGGVEGGAQQGAGITGGETPTNLRSMIRNVLLAVLAFLGLIAVVIIVIAGIMMLVNGDNDETRSKATRAILYAILGLVAILLAVAWVTFWIFSEDGVVV